MLRRRYFRTLERIRSNKPYQRTLLTSGTNVPFACLQFGKMKSLCRAPISTIYKSGPLPGIYKGVPFHLILATGLFHIKVILNFVFYEENKQFFSNKKKKKRELNSNYQSTSQEMVPLVRDDGTSDCRLAPEVSHAACPLPSPANRNSSKNRVKIDFCLSELEF